MSDTAYRADFYAWAKQQAEAARRRSVNEIDWENLAEELEGLSSKEEWELYNRYVVLLTHLLKWKYQPDRRGNSWRRTIRSQRSDIARQLRKAPSLKSVDAEEYRDAYDKAVVEASSQTLIDEDRFPREPPFTREQSLDPEFWPEPDAEVAH